MIKNITIVIVNIGVFTVDFTAGLVLMIFTGLYLVAILYMHFYSKSIIMNELVSFATEYGQIQKRLLRELDLAHAVLDDAGKVVWSNLAFERIVHQEKGFRKSIFALFPSITQDKLPEGYDEVSYELEYDNSNYRRGKKISFNSSY